jgi:DNA invertase Pin-like site-specific DNA recombinase
MPALSLAAAATAAAPLRAFIYQRASHDPRKRATSTADQSTENTRTCAARGWTIAGSFTDDGRSASRHAKQGRPDYSKMIEAIRRGEADIIVAWEASRANRDVVVDRQLVNLCAEMGVLICYNNRVYDPRDPDDRFMLGIGALQAEREADGIQARNSRTTRLNAETGRPHGRIPFGYTREYDPQTGDLLKQVVVESEAELVREIAERIYSGASLNGIAADLTCRGVPTPGGKDHWTPTQVKRVVLKPTNVGLRIFQGRVVGKASWDPILDPEVYEVCEAILTAPDRGHRKDTKIKYLLSGIATCWCGGLIRVRTRGGDSGRPPYYICIKAWDAVIGVAVFDTIAQEQLLAYVERPEFVESLAPVPESEEARSAASGLAELEARLAEATELAAAGALSMVRLSALEQKLQPLIDAAVSGARARLVEVPPVVKQIAGPGAREAWGELDLVQRRSAIRALMTVRLNKAAQGARRVTPDRYTIDFLR